MSDRYAPYADPAFTDNVPSDGSIPKPVAAASSNIDSDINLYFYNPSKALAIIFTILYALHILYHFYLCIWVPLIRRSVPNKHKYTIPLLVAAIISTFGYGVRVASVSNKSSIPLYAVSSSYVVIAPIFVCASLYWLVAHLIALCLPPEGKQQIFLNLNPKKLGIIFITSDVISFMTQGAGSGIAASNNWQGSTKDIGTGVLIAGLALQFATFSLYLLVLGAFCMRVKSGGRSATTTTSTSDTAQGRTFGFNPCVKRVVLGMWIASVFVWIRSIYRLIEFALGINGYPFRHEWMLWVFEATPMWIALAALGIFHPVKWLQQKNRSEFATAEAKILGVNNSNA